MIPHPSLTAPVSSYPAGRCDYLPVPPAPGTDCPFLQLPKTQAGLCPLEVPTPPRPLPVPAGLSHCSSEPAWSRNLGFQAGLWRGPQHLPHRPTAGGLSPALPHPLPWAGPGQGINRADCWAFPTLSFSSDLSPQCFLSWPGELWLPDWHSKSVRLRILAGEWEAGGDQMC